MRTIEQLRASTKGVSSLAHVIHQSLRVSLSPSQRITGNSSRVRFTGLLSAFSTEATDTAVPSFRYQPIVAADCENWIV